MHITTLIGNIAGRGTSFDIDTHIEVLPPCWAVATDGKCIAVVPCELTASDPAPPFCVPVELLRGERSMQSRIVMRGQLVKRVDGTDRVSNVWIDDRGRTVPITDHSLANFPDSKCLIQKMRADADDDRRWIVVDPQQLVRLAEALGDGRSLAIGVPADPSSVLAALTGDVDGNTDAFGAFMPKSAHSIMADRWKRNTQGFIDAKQPDHDGTGEAKPV